MTLGAALTLFYLRDVRRPRLGIIHGLIGAGGLSLLVIVLQGPPRGEAMGAGSFGVVASVLFGIALAFGPLIALAYRRSPRVAGFLIATHASLATTAFVLFLAWASF